MILPVFLSNTKTSFRLRRRGWIAWAPSGMTTFFGCFSRLLLLPANCPSDTPSFLDFCVFGAKMDPKWVPRGRETNHVFHHFRHLGTQRSPRWPPDGPRRPQSLDFACFFTFVGGLWLHFVYNSDRFSLTFDTHFAITNSKSASILSL